MVPKMGVDGWVGGGAVGGSMGVHGRSLWSTAYNVFFVNNFVVDDFVTKEAWESGAMISAYCDISWNICDSVRRIKPFLIGELRTTFSLE